ncbi:MAG: capsid protein [Oscillospiraceae bacterium]
MFESIKNIIKGVRYTMFPISTINEALGINAVTSQSMATAITLWTDLFSGSPPWANDDTVSMGLPASIASELARLSTVESQIEIAGSERGKYLAKQMGQTLCNLRAHIEHGIATGGMVFKPILDGNDITVECSYADNFYITGFDSSGRLSGAVFLEEITRNGTIYRRLEYHHMEGDVCIIENKAFAISALAKNTKDLGKPIDLFQVNEWKDLEPETALENVDRLLLGYFKMPLANNIDAHSPIGVSAYSRAIDSIREADRQWSRLLWEMEGTELAVHIDPTMALADKEGNPIMPKGKERLYRALPGMGTQEKEKKMDVFSPNIRVEPLTEGLNSILKRVEFQCSLAYGTLSDPQMVDKTAEEIRASKQRSYATVKDIQKVLQAALEDLIYAMNVWASLAKFTPEGSYEVTFDWDDSIINDPKERKMLFWQYVSAGRFPFWKYLVEFEGYSEKDAKEIAAESTSTDVLFGGS